MDLYPTTKSQVYEMLWCAGQRGNLNGNSSGHNNNGLKNHPLNNSSSSVGSSLVSSASDSSVSGSSSSGSPDVINRPYLTFGDYDEDEDNYPVVFPPEMKRAYEGRGVGEENASTAPASKIPHKNQELIVLPTASEFISKCNADKSSVDCEVFLGGSCNPTTWRQDIAIPMLKNLGISYFNPQVTDWEPGLIEVERKARDNAEVLLYVIDNQTRALVVMIEMAFFMAKQKKCILVISGFKEPGQKICDEKISQVEYEDLTSGQLILQDLVERHGIPVFNDIQTALNCTAKIIQDKIRPQDLKLSDLAQPVKMGHLQVGNKLINLKKTFDNLDSSNLGEISVSDIRMAYRILTNRELTKKEVLAVLDNVKDTMSQVIIPPNIISNNSSAAETDSTQFTNTSSKKDLNGINGGSGGGTMLNFDQFCYIISELMFHHHHKSKKAWCSLLSNKAGYFLQNISTSLNRLLETVPGSKPGWMPLLSKPDADPVTHPVYDVYLGGDSNWGRLDVIPLLLKHGLTHFNSEINNKTGRTISVDKAIIDKCRVLLFNIPSSTRSIENMIMAAYYSGRGYRVVVCIGCLPEECQIYDEKLSKVAVKDYNRGRAYLSELASREGIAVFEDITEAVQCVVETCSQFNSS